MWKRTWLGVLAGALWGCGLAGQDAGVCAVGEFRCTGDVLETCMVDRTGFQLVATCQAGLCDAAGKQCDSCRAGDGACTGERVGKLCSADGQRLEEFTCAGAAPFCAASGTKASCVACRAAVDCPLSMNACALAVCGADGTCGAIAVAEGTTCSTTGGRCDGAGNCRECTPGEKRCSGMQPQSCGSDGKWVTGAACSAGQSCEQGECTQSAWIQVSSTDFSAGTAPLTYCSGCSGLGCPQVTNGQLHLPGDWNVVCPTGLALNDRAWAFEFDVSGGGNLESVGLRLKDSAPYYQVIITPTQTLCDGSAGANGPGYSGSIVGRWRIERLPGGVTTFFKDGIQVSSVQCGVGSDQNIIGLRFAIGANFSAANATIDNLVVWRQPALACTPGTKACNGNQVLSCNAGGQYDAPVTCSGSTPYCSAATGSCVQCGLSSQCSSPGIPCIEATCTSGACGVAAMADGTVCSVSGDIGTCSSGVCTVCANGATRCKAGSTTVQQVCAAGQWTDQAACGGGTSCVAGACVSTVTLLSRGKVASQSSIHSTGTMLPGEAIDGDYLTISHTAGGQTVAAWWQVDLGSSKTVTRVEIWNRSDCCQSRASNFDIKVSADGVTWATWLSVPSEAQRPSVYQAAASQARYVRIEQKVAQYNNPLNIAEVEVFGY